MKNGTDKQTFFALLRAGLWEQSVRLSTFSSIDFDTLYQLAEEQSVIGLIAAGLEHVEDMTLTKQQVMPFMKQVISLEHRNASMNIFIVSLVVKMKQTEIEPVLVKGQGIAQCYDRPLWRACGDVDFLLSDSDYQKAKALLTPIADSVEHEGLHSKHLGMKIKSWTLELHGSLRCNLSHRIDKTLERIKDVVLTNGIVRVWKNGESRISLPDANEDIVYVFTHFLSHFYKGGVGLRQICDWCRLIWTYRDAIDTTLLSNRLISMRLTSEWKAFAALAVSFLGIPVDAMPLYDPARKWKRKAERIQAFIIKVGNFGHNRDFSYYSKYPYLIRKTISLGHRCADLYRHAAIFPFDSIRFFPSIVFNGLRSAARGE